MLVQKDPVGSQCFTEALIYMNLVTRPSKKKKKKKSQFSISGNFQFTDTEMPF